MLERELQECPGGTQLHYVCRPVRATGEVRNDMIKLNEVEVKLAPGPSLGLRRVERKKLIRETLCLLNSMAACGEKPSDQSRKLFDESLMAIERL